MISLILPSRQRPEKAIKAALDWSAKAGGQYEFILSLDSDDPTLFEYTKIIDLLPVIPKIEINDNKNAVQAINNAAKKATGDIIIVMSDDFLCPDIWIRRIEKAVEGKRDFVLKTFDGIQNYIVTLPIMDRVYYERFSYIYHPSYEHMFCDTELTHVADLLHKLHFRNDLLFEHAHHSVTKQRQDVVTKKAEATQFSGSQTYLKRCKRKFDLIGDIDLLEISKEGFDHKRWLKQHGM